MHWVPRKTNRNGFDSDMLKLCLNVCSWSQYSLRRFLANSLIYHTYRNISHVTLNMSDLHPTSKFLPVSLNPSNPGRRSSHFKCVTFKIHLKINIRGTPLMIAQQPFGLWLGAVRQHAITWNKVQQDLCHHMASQGHKEHNIFVC